jgi:UDP-glucose 4-epimerase
VLATQRLLGPRAAGPRFVYASSSSVYGDTTDLPMREQSLPRPISPYGVTKLAAST